MCMNHAKFIYTCRDKFGLRNMLWAQKYGKDWKKFEALCFRLWIVPNNWEVVWFSKCFSANLAIFKNPIALLIVAYSMGEVLLSRCYLWASGRQTWGRDLCLSLWSVIIGCCYFSNHWRRWSYSFSCLSWEDFNLENS